MSREVTVVNSDGDPILYCSCKGDGSLEASFEIYGNANQSDLEIIDVVYTSGFSKLKEVFGIPNDVHILDAVQAISDRGDGQKFKDFIRERTLPGEHFSWMTDRD